MIPARLAWREQRASQAGLTLIETLIVIVVIGVATGAAMMGLNGADRGDRAQAEDRKAIHPGYSTQIKDLEKQRSELEEEKKAKQKAQNEFRGLQHKPMTDDHGFALS